MTQYAYSFNGEEYHGPFDTKGEAIGEALDRRDDEDQSVWIGEVKHPLTWIIPQELGVIITNDLKDWLGDEVGEVAENFDLTREQQVELGKAVLDVVERAGGFRCFSVENVYKVDASELEE